MNTKKIYITFFIIILILILILTLLAIKIIPCGTKTYEIREKAQISIPKISIVKSEEECVDMLDIQFDRNSPNHNEKKICINKITFDTILNQNSTIKILEKSIQENKSILCNNNRIVYYCGGLTILDYGIEKEGFINTFYIKFVNHIIDADDCYIIKDVNNFEYDYNTYMVNEEDQKNKKLKTEFQYLDKDGNKYDVYTTCSECLKIKNGVGFFNSFRSMMSDGYIDMQNFN